MPWGTHQSVPDPRNEDVLVYINGEFVPRDRASVSVFDSGYLVGDGVWEGMRLHRGRILHIDRHFDRLFGTAASVGLDIGKTRDELLEILSETIHRNHMETDVHLRLMITRGSKETPSQDPRLTVTPPTIVVIAEHKVADPDVTRRGVALHTSSVRRPPPETLDQRWNCHSKIHEVAALNEALAAGADEALMLDMNGHVATCNATNFFVVCSGEVWTSTGLHCLNGITRELVIEVAAEDGITVRQCDFDLDDVYGADEAFVTGTFGGLTPVISVDGRTIGDGAPGPMTARLTGLYRAALEEEARS